MVPLNRKGMLIVKGYDNTAKEVRENTADEELWDCMEVEKSANEDIGVPDGRSIPSLHWPICGYGNDSIGESSPRHIQDSRCRTQDELKVRVGKLRIRSVIVVGIIVLGALSWNHLISLL